MNLVVHNPGDSKYLVIGEGDFGCDNPVPFQSEAGELLEATLAICGIDPIRVEIKRKGKTDGYDFTYLMDSNGKNLYDIIKENNVENVISLGRQIAASLAPDMVFKKTTAKLNSFPFLRVPNQNFRLAVAYSPHQILRDKDLDIISYSRRFETLINEESQSAVNVDYSFVDIQELKEFLMICEEFGQNVGFDVESNGAELHSVDFRLTGFSVSIRTSETDVRSVWYTWTEQESDEDVKWLGDWLQRNESKVIAFNCGYEIRTVADIFYRICKFKDAIVTITMDGNRSSLKDAARKYLGVDFWEGNTHEWIDRFKKYFGWMTKQCTPEQLEEIKNRTFDLDNHLKLMAEYEEELEAAETQKAKRAVRPKHNKCVVDILVELEDELELDEALYLLSYYPYEWGAVPRDILGEYCCYDSAYTVVLHDKVLPAYSEHYDTYMLHPYLAATFEMNGIRWDDKAAEVEFDYCLAGQIEMLSGLLPMLNLDMETKMDALDYANRTLPYENVWYTPSGLERRAMVTTNEGRHEDLKYFFNPNSNTKDNRALFWDAYLDDRIRLGTMLWSVVEEFKVREIWDKVLIESASNFDSDDVEEIEKRYLCSASPDTILQTFIGIGENTDFNKKYGADFCTQVANGINDGIGWYEEAYTGKFAGPTMEAQLNIHTKIFGIDPESPETWDDKFKMLMYFKLYKRYGKSIGTYINGSTGRANVWVAKDQGNGMPPLRIRGYWDNINNNDGKLEDGEFYLLCTGFNSLSAITSRWTSGYHTVPGDGSVRKCYIPMEDDMLWAHVDYSQAELVMVSMFSQDKEMQQVFLDGGDMHAFVASVAYHKAIEAVSKLERSAGKGINFGIVYQMSMESLAMAATGGDVDAAKQLVQTVFGRFPELEKWILTNKESGFETGFAYGYFGNKINLEGTNVNSTSVNYPIQCTSSMAAGAGMYFLDTDFKAQNMNARSHGFVHDSDDITFKVKDLFKVMGMVKKNMEEELYSRWSMPMRTDFEFGVNAYNLCELEDVEEIDGGYVGVVKGPDESVVMLLDKLRMYWELDIELIKKEEDYSPFKDAFNQKSGCKSDSRRWGSSFYKLKYKVTFRHP